jgi:hypothetical protein
MVLQGVASAYAIVGWKEIKEEYIMSLLQLIKGAGEKTEMPTINIAVNNILQVEKEQWVIQFLSELERALLIQSCF